MKIIKKLISIALSVLLVLSMLPFSALTAYAAPSTKKTASSVAAASSYYIHDLGSGEVCYYFDSLQDAFNYVNTNTKCNTVTLLKDFVLDEPITFTDEVEGEFKTLYVELDGHTVEAPNGNAFEFYDMYTNIFVNGYQQAYDEGNGITGYGAVFAKDYAFASYEGLCVVISAGTYSSDTKAAPFYVDDAYEGFCNIRQCAIINSENIVCDRNGYFGNDGNVYLRHVDGDHLNYFHIVDGVVGEKPAYIVENHSIVTATESIAPDRQSASITSKCTVCNYVKKSYAAAALIGDTAYQTLSQAIGDVGDGESAKIELLSDAALGSVDVNNNKNIEIDLNGHTINHPSGYLTVIGGTLEMYNGTINSNSNMTFYIKGSSDSTAVDYSNLKLHDITVNNTYCVPAGDDDYYTGVTIMIDNPLTSWKRPVNCYGINVDADKAILTSAGCVVSVNGMYINTEELNCVKLNFNESELTSQYETAMYIAGYAHISSTDTDFTGYISAIELRAGILDLFEGNNTLTATIDDFGFVETYRGTTTWGAALAVAQHSADGHPDASGTVHNPITVNIYGGEFNGQVAVNDQHGPSYPTDKYDVKLNIYDGEFNGEQNAVYTDSNNVNNSKVNVLGGKFSYDVEPSLLPTDKQTRLEADGMYVLTDLDYTAYRVAVQFAASVDRSIFTDESLSALDSAILKEYELNTQTDIDVQTNLIETRYNELEYKSFDITLNVCDSKGTISPQTFTYKYGEIAEFDISYVDEDVYKWTVSCDGSTKRLPTDEKNVSFVVKGDTDVTVYTTAKPEQTEQLTKVTFVSHKNVTVSIDYVENVNNVIEPEAPVVPFYSFVEWEKVDDTTYKAKYSYSSGHCKFVGGMNVTVTNGGNVSTNNDDGIDVPYDDVVEVSSSVAGQLALAADKEGTKILTYINDVTTIHAPKRETVYVIVLPNIADATVGVTGGYVSRVEGTDKTKVAVNGQFFLPDGCTMVDCGIVLCNKDGEFEIGGTGVIKLASTMQSTSNEFTVALTTNYGSMTAIYARTYLTYRTIDGTLKTIYSKTKAINPQVVGNID